MYSATAQMISQNQHTAAAIAAKLTQTEGVEYTVVKETKGFRVVKTGKPTLAMKMLEDAPLVSASTAPKPKMTDTGVSPNNVIEPSPIGQPAQVLPFGSDFQVTCELRSETPTMIKAMIAGQPRAFEKKHLTGWTVTQANAGNPATVVLKMSAAQAKKWKLPQQ